MKFSWLLLSLPFILTGYLTADSGRQIKVEVDWPNFMDKHNLVWDTFPGRWENSPFIGNGLVGAMMWASPDSTHVKWFLGRSDVGRLDFPGRGQTPVRVQIGSMNLETVGKILVEESSAELDLWNAEARGIIKTTRGKIKWRSFTLLDEAVIVVELYGIEGEEKDCRWVTEFNSQGNCGFTDGVDTYTVEDRQHHLRSEVSSGGHTIAWIEDIKDGARRLYVSISSSPVTRRIWDTSSRRNLSSLEDAKISIKTVVDEDFNHLITKHRNWWQEFYPKSFMSLPKRELETYYWIQLYKMASASREGYPMIDNHGPWSVEPAYGFATWDLNVQSTYRLHLKSNHLSLGEPLIRFMDSSFNHGTMWNKAHGELRAGIRQQTFLRYRFFDTEFWEHSPEETPTDGPAKFLWGCHNYWMQYRFSKDETLSENLLPKLEGGINAMAARLEQGEDGKLHIPSGRNWENWIGKDPTGLLAVLNWALSTARVMGEELGYDEAKLARWEYLQTNLAEYPVGTYPDGKTGFLLGREFIRLVQGDFHFGETPLPHRHWTHLLMIFPLYTLTWDQRDKRDLIKNSIDYWSLIASGLNGEKPRAGYSPCASISLYASIGHTEKISELFDKFLYKETVRGPSVWASTMYRELGPVLETPFLFAAALQDLLLQSYNGIIKVFPAVPYEWDDAVFHNFRAEGGFVISAKFRSRKTEFISIESLAGEDFFLETDMEHIKYDNSDGSAVIEKVDDYRFRIKLAKGGSVLMFNKQSDSDFTVRQIKDQSGSKNSFGLNERFLEKRELLKDRFFQDN